MKYLSLKNLGWFGIGAAIAIAFVIFHSPARGNKSHPSEQGQSRRLVVLIHGTFDEKGKWFLPSESQDSFADTLAQDLGESTDVIPFRWSTAESLDLHQQRLIAAQGLLELLNDHSRDYEEIVLIGHSHGGNVALLTASASQRKIDAVICLATPHIGFRLKGITAPVYCSPAAVDHSNHILAISSSSDWVTGNWQDVLYKGLTENEAVRLTSGWRNRTGIHRPLHDSILARAIKGSNLTAYSELNIDAVKNVKLKVSSTDFWKIRAHGCAHSKAVASYLAEVIASEFDQTVIDSIRFLNIPESDLGEPTVLGAL